MTDSIRVAVAFCQQVVLKYPLLENSLVMLRRQKGQNSRDRRPLLVTQTEPNLMDRPQIFREREPSPGLVYQKKYSADKGKKYFSRINRTMKPDSRNSRRRRRRRPLLSEVRTSFDGLTQLFLLFFLIEESS